jgi:hypothetical protein
MKHTFNEKYQDGTVILRDGTQFPLLELFDRNPAIQDVYQFQPTQTKVPTRAFARSYWDGTKHVLTFLEMGSSCTMLARKFV